MSNYAGLTFEEAQEREQKEYAFSEDCSTRRWRAVIESKLEHGRKCLRECGDYQESLAWKGYILAVEELQKLL